MFTLGFLGFLLASYSVIANDVIQTLGTFLSSNHTKSWILLWGFASTILTATLLYSWYFHGGDPAYGRLDQVPLPDPLPWWYLMAPLTLLLITRFGIPVSTTFMILSVFSSGQLIEKMLLKSVLGYLLALVFSLGLYYLIARNLESGAALRLMGIRKKKRFWIIAQWGSTAFLWTQWLIQDFANIFVFLPRSLSLYELLPALAVILVIMAYIFNKRGGKIQDIVNKKANTKNIRSATLIDLCYGALLFVFGNLTTVPMSTTWAFIGILAGRELALKYRLNKKELKASYRLVVGDLTKVNIGLAVSVLLAYLIGVLNT